MAKIDPAIHAHLEWIGFVQPTGLVVSAPALVRAGAILDRRDVDGQQRLRICVEERIFDPKEGPVPHLPDFRRFAEQVLSWSFSPKGYAGTDEQPIPPELELPLPEYRETLRPDFAVRELNPHDGGSPWQLLIRVLSPGEDFDRIIRENGGLEASAQGRMERLLRQTGVSAGLLFNGLALRLISAPRGESSGWLDFHVADMVETAGRPISTALRMLLSQTRLLSLPSAKRLAALLEDSRKFQNEVSERLAEQVLHALYELLRGFQAAHDASKGELLRDSLAEQPDEVYRALLTVILRLVFLLYAEERDMLPEDETFLRYYSLGGLYEGLREDAALYPDTMDQRFGAWAQLLVLFRMIHDGAIAGAMRLPKRHGVLFDPDRFKFLEGRPSGGARHIHERIEPPLVPDSTIFRALEKLLVLDGERISYRALDVEQIGSVYETMMGFRLETATGCSAAIKAAKKHGAPTTIDLEALLEEASSKRRKWIQDRTDRKLTDRVHNAVKEAATLEDLHAALETVLDKYATPDLVPKRAMILQPSEERRRSGSHYTPRTLTEPIVRTTLEPILARLRGEDRYPPRPEKILDLKVCDPAMGSGAFLVEACRQLGDALVESWSFHDVMPEIPPDENEVIYARRLIAQRCLYGVDKNSVAVDLAKLSLWLITLAREHSFTFVDHALRHGDSLVGLSRNQIEAFHWDPDAPRFQTGFETMRVHEHVAKVAELRQQIREADEKVADWELRDLWNETKFELGKVRLFGDLVLAAFFGSEKANEREAKRSKFASEVASGDVGSYFIWLEEWRHADQPLATFHWEIELPEIFQRENPGFDAIVGNPPFAGKNTMASANIPGYPEWLKKLHEESHGNSNLVAHFFRRSFNLLREDGAFGLIATNTIAQGDTRASGLRWICQRGGTIFAARKRVKWPGLAAVVVSIIHLRKGPHSGPKYLDKREVEKITAFLLHRGDHNDPARLDINIGLAFVGNYVLGDGFIFDDLKSSRWPISRAKELLEDSRNAEVLRPFLGGDELNRNPEHQPLGFVIDFGDRDGVTARKWPDLFALVEEQVQPERTKYSGSTRDCWWRHARTKAAYYARARKLNHVIVTSQTSAHRAFSFAPTSWTFDQTVIVVISNSFAMFAMLSSRLHENWSHVFGLTMKDDPRYTPSDCFDTFPFVQDWQDRSQLRIVGEAYYKFRAALMKQNDEGLTKTYNRFHDLDERDLAIGKLRELHAVMDRAVLDAYGWSDIQTDCEFLLDYEIDENEEGSRRKKPWRYRWPNEVHDEVLARLLELNAERAREEELAGLTKKEDKGGKGRKNRSPNPSSTGDLFS